MSTLPNANEPISRLELERWALGTLDAQRSAQLATARQSDPDLDARMLRVQEQITQASADMPQLVLPADEPEVERVSWLQWLLRPQGLTAAGLLAAAVVLIAVGPALLDPGPEVSEDPRVRYRGLAPELSIYRVRAGEAAEQGPLIKAQAGDRIQYDIVAPRESYLSIYNVQDNGELQVYLPAQPVQAGESVSSAVLLDDYTGTERIFFILGEEPIDEVTVTGAVQRAYRQPLADLDALPGLPAAQRSVLIVKEAP